MTAKKTTPRPYSPSNPYLKYANVRHYYGPGKSASWTSADEWEFQQDKATERRAHMHPVRIAEDTLIIRPQDNGGYVVETRPNNPGAVGASSAFTNREDLHEALRNLYA